MKAEVATSALQINVRTPPFSPNMCQHWQGLVNMPVPSVLLLSSEDVEAHTAHQVVFTIHWQLNKPPVGAGTVLLLLLPCRWCAMLFHLLLLHCGLWLHRVS
jgi:hypothetical protein